MIECYVRCHSLKSTERGGPLCTEEDEVWEEKRFFRAECLQSVQPSDYDGWGAKVRFQDGKEWTVRADPEWVADTIDRVVEW